MFKYILNWLTGSTLDRILSSVDNTVDNQTKREEIKADVTKEYLKAKAQLLLERTWWYQLFFVVPLGIWFTAVVVDSIFTFDSWDVAALPAPLDEWGGWIITALFLVEGGNKLVGRFKR